MHPDAPPKLVSFNVLDELQNLSEAELKQIAEDRQLPYAVALVNITGDLNTGTIIRSAAAMGAQKVFMFGKKRYDRRSTVGAHNYINILHNESSDEETHFDWTDAFQHIRVHGYTPIIIEQEGPALWHFDPSSTPTPPCLVFGAEQGGIPTDVCEAERWFSIPQPGIIRSLNVSAAAAIAMWHVSAQILRFGVR